MPNRVSIKWGRALHIVLNTAYGGSIEKGNKIKFLRKSLEEIAIALKILILLDINIGYFKNSKLRVPVSLIGNCDIYVKQNISGINEMKHLLSLSLSVFSKVDCQISVSFTLIRNFEISDLAMTKI